MPPYIQAEHPLTAGWSHTELGGPMLQVSEAVAGMKAVAPQLERPRAKSLTQ